MHVAAPQWIEWEFSLRPGMGIGRVQALQLPAADGAVHHQLTFDGKVVSHILFGREILLNVLCIVYCVLCIVSQCVLD